MRKERSVAEMLRDPRPIAGGDGTDDQYEALDEEIRSQLGTVAELSDEELGELHEKLTAIAKDAVGDEDTNPSDEDLALAQQALAARDSVVATEVGEREAKAEERRTKADELRGKLEPVAEEETEEEEETSTEGEGGDGETETTEKTKEVKETETTETKAEEPEPVAASAKSKRKPPGAANAHRPKNQVPTGKKSEAKLALVAAADVQGFGAGAPISTIDKLAKATEAKARPILASANQKGVTGRWGIAAAELDYPEDRYLRDGDLAGNMKKIEAIASPEAIIAAIHDAGGLEALVAAGGICTPLPVRYEIGGADPTTERPFRDALVRFGADRGGVSVPDPLQLTDVEGAVGIWTEATDETPGGSTKTVLTLSCGDNDDFQVDAITARVKTGNWLRRFSRERFDRAWLLIQAVHARIAENDLWRKVTAESKNVGAGQDLGAARDILFKTRAAAMHLRNLHRLPFELPIQAAFPSWARDMIAGDLVRQLPGDGTLAVAYSEINSYFAAANIAPIWSPDAQQVLAVQPDGQPLVGYPSTMKALIFPAGTYGFLDGGRLDFGMEIRDSTLNATNDVEAFFETFEGVAKFGVESYELTFNGICADGSTSSTVDVVCAGSGS